MSSEEVKTQSLLMNIYSFIFARKIREELADVAKANCLSCEIYHPSHTHHSCLMMSESCKINAYGFTKPRIPVYYDDCSSMKTANKFKKYIYLFIINIKDSS